MEDLCIVFAFYIVFALAGEITAYTLLPERVRVFGLLFNHNIFWSEFNLSGETRAPRAYISKLNFRTDLDSALAGMLGLCFE